MLWPIVREHLDSAGFLWSRWLEERSGPAVGLPELERHERRLLAHLDALVVGGLPVQEQVLWPTLEGKVDGGHSAAVLGSEFSSSLGDEAGTAGGVKSGTVSMEASWLTCSFNVRFEGRGACRLTDKMLMNHANTACLAGVLQAPVAALEAASHQQSLEEAEVHVRLPLGPGTGAHLSDKFTLVSEDGSYSQTRTVKDDRVPGDDFLDLVFTGVNPRGRYSLRATQPGKQPYTIFDRVAYARLSHLTRPAAGRNTWGQVPRRVGCGDPDAGAGAEGEVG